MARATAASVTIWRREWDSNPRYAFTHTRFPSVRLKPLGHPSAGGMEASSVIEPSKPSASMSAGTTKLAAGEPDGSPAHWSGVWREENQSADLDALPGRCIDRRERILER